MRLYQQAKNIYHWLQAHLWRVWYGNPQATMRIYGITGTNGKTTTCYILRSILAARYGEEQVGMLTTVAFRIGEREIINETKMTTLPSRTIYKYLRDMKQAGVRHVVLEMTSHALDQRRCAGLKLSGAIILNIEREHLDYHKTLKAYARAKARIDDYLKSGSPLVVNKEFSIFNFQFSNGRVIEFSGDDAKDVVTPLEGGVNKENALAASLLAQAIGIKQKFIDAGVQAVKSVPGRMEWVSTEVQSPKFKVQSERPRVLIDYAVTPEALDRLYAYVRSITTGRVLGLLGAAGLRDRGKRPDMAKAVATYADVLVLTREDPWTEDEEQIFSDLEKGLSGQGAGPVGSLPVLTNFDPKDRELQKGSRLVTRGSGNQPVAHDEKTAKEKKLIWKRIADRREALKWLLDQAGPDDVIVVTGKGAERGMGIGKKIVPWNDKKVILDLLRQMK